MNEADLNNLSMRDLTTRSKYAVLEHLREAFYFPLVALAILVNIPCMHCIRILMSAALCSIALICNGFCEVAGDEAAKVSALKPESFNLASVVHPRLSEFFPPTITDSIEGVQCKLSAKTPEVRDHVRQGFALVHAQWQFEAYRHFCAALLKEPDCLMAYAGVALSWIQPFNEYSNCRKAAVKRMLELSDADDATIEQGREGIYLDSEKRFVRAVAALVAQKPDDAAKLFLQLAQDDPSCLQAKVIGLFLNRGEYNVANEPSQKRQRVLEQTREMLEDYPENALIMGFWLMLNAEAPNSALNIKTDILPYARFLTKKYPKVPSWQHALGHYEWRSGNYLLAERAFRRAAKIYEQWMASHNITLADCEGYVKSKCYLANALYQMGDFTEAMKVAMSLRALKPDPQRPLCEGNQMILWRAYHLPARLYITRDGAQNLNKALETLPRKDELQAFVSHQEFPTLAGVYIEALAAYIGSRKALLEGSFQEAGRIRNNGLRALIRRLAQVVEGAMRSPDFTHYFNAGSSLAVYNTELAGLIAQAGDLSLSSTALNHFMSARDKQGTPSLMMPPLVLSAMENRVGDYYYSIGRHADAYEAYVQGLERYPHNMESLLGVHRTLVNLGREDEAQRISEHIELIRNARNTSSSN